MSGLKKKPLKIHGLKRWEIKQRVFVVGLFVAPEKLELFFWANKKWIDLKQKLIGKGMKRASAC